MLDAVGLLLFVAGAAVFGWAWFGFRAVQQYEAPPDAELWAAVQVADGYWRLQQVGTGLMMAGVAVFVAAWWTARWVSGKSEKAEVR